MWTSLKCHTSPDLNPPVGWGGGGVSLLRALQEEEKKQTTLHVHHSFFVHFFAVVLHNYNVNFRKLPSYKFYGGYVVPVLVHFFFSLAAHFHLGDR